MTADARRELRRLIDQARRDRLVTPPNLRVCPYPPCGKLFAPSPHSPLTGPTVQRYCCPNHKTNDWHRRNKKR